VDLLRSIETFVAIAESSSFSSAARRLRLTPSAVSKQIAALEAELGVGLILRTTRELSLTNAGNEYLLRAKRILREVAEAQNAVRSHHKVLSGTLRISAPATFGRLHVAPAMPHFMHLYPDLHVELGLYDRQTDPITAGVDVAIRMGHLRDSSMIAAKLAGTRRVLCASPDYFARWGTPQEPEDLVGHNCLLSTLYTVRNTWFFTRGEEIRPVVVDGTFSTNNSEGLRDVALGGIGIGLLGSWAVARNLRDGTLVAALTDWRGELTRDVRNIYAVYPKAAHIAPGVRAFVTFLRRHWGSPPIWETGEAVRSAEMEAS
jgi:DNA-binding transcriptional LysR family regulator